MRCGVCKAKPARAGADDGLCLQCWILCMVLWLQRHKLRRALSIAATVGCRTESANTATATNVFYGPPA